MTPETDRADIIELFGRYADIADTKNFNELPPLVHTDPFTMDFESMTGMPLLQTPLNDYAAAFRDSFELFVATHHAITGHVITIDGDHATAHALGHFIRHSGGLVRWVAMSGQPTSPVSTSLR